MSKCSSGFRFHGEYLVLQSDIEQSRDSEIGFQSETVFDSGVCVITFLRIEVIITLACMVGDKNSV